jgi:hypothetical protein
MPTTKQTSLRYAIAMSNVSVALLQRGLCNEAIETIKQSCHIVKIIAASVTDDPTQQVSDTVFGRVVTTYELGNKRLFHTESRSGYSNTTMNQVHVVVFNDHVMSFATTGTNIIPKGAIYPIRLEYTSFDTIDIGLLLSMQLYNLSLMYFFKAKYSSSNVVKTDVSENILIATKLIRKCYSIAPPCDIRILDFDSRKHLKINCLILSTLTLILQEDIIMHREECLYYQNRLVILAKQHEYEEQSMMDNIFLTSAAAA